MKRYKRKRGMQVASSAVQLINCKILTEISCTLHTIKSRTYTANSAIRAAIKSKESTTPEEFKDLLLEWNKIFYEDVRYKT